MKRYRIEYPVKRMGFGYGDKTIIAHAEGDGAIVTITDAGYFTREVGKRKRLSACVRYEVLDGYASDWFYNG